MKAAILGCGGMGRTVLGHLRDCPEIDGCTAYDVSPEQARLTREQFPEVSVTDDLDSVLSDEMVKVCFVTSSNDAHKELSLRAMRAGKAVMCEKPMANTLEDAREMVDFAEKNGLFLQIGLELRYSLLYTQVKEWIDAGLLGRVLNTHCFYVSSAFESTSWRRLKSGSGSMFGEKLCHYVDLPRWWVGSEACSVYSSCAQNIVPYLEIRDNYHTTYTFENGAVSHLTFMMGPACTFRGDPLTDMLDQQRGDGHALRYLVVGDEGCAEADVFNRSLKRWEFSMQSGEFLCDLMETRTWDWKEDHFYFHNTHDQTLDIVRRVAAGEGPKTPARDAFQTMRLVAAAEESADSGRIVYLR